MGWPIVGVVVSGVNNARRVPCVRSKDHGFYPQNEACPWCVPEEDKTPTLEYGYYGWTSPGKAK